ncbi:FecR family protein [Chitinophaga deserti]|uniref:FecR family protein n=1 Tax=Chitinophaga deserti TaxID=2164099 RepID=UPI000D6B3CB9|nr:FecR family protein [Chitinophaga deserti]
MTRDKIISCLEKYASGTLTPEEEQAFHAWLDTASPDEFHAMLDEAGVSDALKAYPVPTAASVAGLRQRLEYEEQLPAPHIYPIWRKIAAAAAVLLLVAGSWFIYRQTQQQDKPAITQAPKPVPGGNKATLTLGDGSVINLDDANAGDLSQQGNTRIVKLDGGRIQYHSEEDGGAPVYNTIATPNGGQYQVQLPDGTVVWMNAASSLRFPSAFTGNERLVELTGEGYFEVAADAAKPFRVKVSDAVVEVLGTKFNVNAYAEEPQARTALLEGAVRVTRKGNAVQLRPGQEARFIAGGMLEVKAADMEQALAWKNGYFQFEGTTLPVLLRQIGRWYDVEVEWKGDISDREFAGRIARNVSLQAMVDALRSSGVNCRIQGRKLEVLP